MMSKLNVFPQYLLHIVALLCITFKIIIFCNVLKIVTQIWQVVQDFLSTLNPLRPNSHQSQTSHCNVKGLSVREVMRIENIITQVKLY